MEQQQVLFYLYCCMVLIVPAYANLFINILQIINFFISSLVFHFLRAYLASGPPGNQTVFQGIFISLTYLGQAFQVYLFIGTTFGLFKGLALSFLQTYPNIFCTMATPRPFVMAFALYVMYLSFFKLLMTIKQNVFLNLNHEKIVLQLNIATAVIVMVLLVAEMMLEKGSYCNPKMAWMIVSLRIGLQVNVKDFANEGNEKHLPLILIILALAFVCFAIFAVISTVRRTEEALTQQNYEINVQSNRERVNYFHSTSGSNIVNGINPVRVPIDLPLVEPHRALPNADQIVTTSEHINIQPVSRPQPKKAPILTPIPKLTYVASFQASTSTTPWYLAF